MTGVTGQKFLSLFLLPCYINVQSVMRLMTYYQHVTDRTPLVQFLDSSPPSGDHSAGEGGGGLIEGRG